MHVRGRGVARLPGVDDGDAASGAGQDQRGRQAGGSTADHHHVVGVGAVTGTLFMVTRIAGCQPG